MVMITMKMIVMAVMINEIIAATVCTEGATQNEWGGAAAAKCDNCNSSSYNSRGSSSKVVGINEYILT